MSNALDALYKIENDDTRPQYNLALEEYLCELAGSDAHNRKNFFMLWRNEPSVIIGRFQNARAEVNESFIREHGIHVVRRNSGGGAVYHDLGNVNYSFIVTDTDSDEARELTGTFESFTRPIVNALLELGLPVEMSGRNDIVIKSKTDRVRNRICTCTVALDTNMTSTIEHRKISGGAEWHHNGVILHHGTLLFDCDLDVMSRVLNVAPEKRRRDSDHHNHTKITHARAVPSVRSRVANIRPLLRDNMMDMTVESFMKFLADQICSETSTRSVYALTSEDKCEIQRLMCDKYLRPSWNWNANVQYDIDHANNHDYYQNDHDYGLEYFHIVQGRDHNDIAHIDNISDIDHDRFDYDQYDIDQKSDHDKYDHSMKKIIKVKRRFWWGIIECKMQVRDSHDSHNRSDSTITSCEFSGDYFSFNDDVEFYNKLCKRFVGLTIDDLTPAKLREVLSGINIGALFAGAEPDDLVTLFTKNSAP